MSVSRRVFLSTSFAFAAVATARSLSATLSRLANARAVIRDLLATHSIAGFSIAVTRANELLWAEGFGKADLELDVAVTPAHRFRLGSVSKLFTATLAAQMAAKQVVDLDAPISNYLPALPPQHRVTTLKQLLTHRGGVRHYSDKDFETPNIDQRRYLNNDAILDLFIHDPLVAQPGERVSYSTFGYTLASLVLEAAAKTPFLELLQREISAPLGLTSLAGDVPSTLAYGRVSGYHVAEGNFSNIPQNNPAYKWAGGGLLATPTDVARFGSAHLAPGKLSEAALRTLFTVYTQATGGSAPLGLGWRIDADVKQRPRWHHAGGQDGARASLVVYPNEKLAIAMASNVTGQPNDVNAVSAKISDVFA